MIINRLLPVLVLLASCTSVSNETSSEKMIIAIGSCNHQDMDQPMWKEIIKEKPDLWVWLGDNIYGDSDVIDTLESKYKRLLGNPDYNELKNMSEVIGTWDDHDYGKNDGGVEFISKKGSQKAFMDFMEIPSTDPMRNRDGVYSSQVYTLNGKKIKILLLDSRYHRDQVERVDGVYNKNLTGTVLGDQQWEWLESELTNSSADIHLIGNGIQIISEQHRFEKWANFPNERARLLNMVSESKAKGVIFLSGDRHISEISEVQLEPMSYPLRDFTSSGLTHSYEEAGAEINRHRVSPLVGMKNFGLLEITTSPEEVTIKTKIRGLNDTTFFETTWVY